MKLKRSEVADRLDRLAERVEGADLHVAVMTRDGRTALDGDLLGAAISITARYASLLLDGSDAAYLDDVKAEDDEGAVLEDIVGTVVAVLHGPAGSGDGAGTGERG